MKKLLLILSCCFTFSCGNSDSVEISKVEYAKLKGVNVSPYPKPFQLNERGLGMYDSGIVLGSDNHEYLVTNARGQSRTVEHYVDCEFCAKRIKNQ